MWHSLGFGVLWGKNPNFRCLHFQIHCSFGKTFLYPPTPLQTCLGGGGVLFSHCPSVCPSAILSHFQLVSSTPPTVLKLFWWNFTASMHITRRWSCCTMVMLDWFLEELWPFIENSCVHNSTYSSKAIFVKLYRITHYHLKMIILCGGHAPLIIKKVISLFPKFTW